APIANTVQTLPIVWFKPRAGNIGNTIVAVVIMATEEEPCAVLSNEATIKGKNKPKLLTTLFPDKYSAMLTCAISAPKAPPAPIINKISPAFSTAWRKRVLKSFLFQFRFPKIAKKIPIPNATSGAPMAYNDFSKKREDSSIVINDRMPINNIGITIGNTAMPTGGSCCCVACSVTALFCFDDAVTGIFLVAYFAQRKPQQAVGIATSIP